MKKLLVLALFSTSVFAEYEVIYSEKVYKTVEDCVLIKESSAAGTVVGGTVGGATGAVVGKALLGGWGSLFGGLVGSGVGAEVGNSVGGNTKQICTEKRVIAGYYNHYIKNGTGAVAFDINKLEVIK